MENKHNAEMPLTVEFGKPTPEDEAEMIRNLGSCDMLSGRTKITVRDGDGNTGVLFMNDETIEMLGKDYIQSHARLYYSSFLDNWGVTVSQNDYYNDPERSPEKEIHLQFVEIECGTGREVYRDIATKRYFLRENFYPRENFAKWYICGTKRKIDDGNEVRPNLVFVYNGQREKVTYHDWNGTAAYSDTFNVSFRTGINGK